MNEIITAARFVGLLTRDQHTARNKRLGEQGRCDKPWKCFTMIEVPEKGTCNHGYFTIA